MSTDTIRVCTTLQAKRIFRSSVCHCQADTGFSPTGESGSQLWLRQAACQADTSRVRYLVWEESWQTQPLIPMQFEDIIPALRPHTPGINNYLQLHCRPFFFNIFSENCSSLQRIYLERVSLFTNCWVESL